MGSRFFVLAATYVSSICAANALVWWLGPWWSPFNSLLLIGLDLSLRDTIHERCGFTGSIVLVAVGGAVSYVLNPAAGQIALASVIAFTASGIADGAAYQSLIKRRSAVKMNASNAVGAIVDSLLFPTIAFGDFMPGIVALQFGAKVIGGAMYAFLLTRK